MQSRGWLIITLAKSIYLKEISEKRAKKTKTTKQSIISSISSTELTKLKRLIKFLNQTVVQLGRGLGPKPPQPEPSLQLHETMR